MTFLGLPSFRAAQIVAQTGLDVSAGSSQLLTVLVLTITT